MRDMYLEPRPLPIRSTASSGLSISGADQPREPKPNEAVEEARESVLERPKRKRSFCLSETLLR